MSELPRNTTSTPPDDMAEVIDMRHYIRGLARRNGFRSDERIESDITILDAYSRYERSSSEAPTEVLPAVGIPPVRQSFDIQETDQLNGLETDEL